MGVRPARSYAAPTACAEQIRVRSRVLFEHGMDPRSARPATGERERRPMTSGRSTHPARPATEKSEPACCWLARAGRLLGAEDACYAQEQGDVLIQAAGGVDDC